MFSRGMGRGGDAEANIAGQTLSPPPAYSTTNYGRSHSVIQPGLLKMKAKKELISSILWQYISPRKCKVGQHVCGPYLLCGRCF